MACGKGTRYGIPRLAVPNATLGTHCGTFAAKPSNGWSKLGRDGFGGAAKLNAVVMSPVALLRQAVRLGTGAPNRVSSNRRCEGWSNVSWHVSGPRMYGEMTKHGTRKPKPIGPLMPPDPGTALMSGTVRYSPGVPAGAVGGMTWSKKPPCSSYMTISAVFSQTAGL